MLALKTAMASAFKSKNYINAASFARRLLELPDMNSERNADSRSKAQKVRQRTRQDKGHSTTCTFNTHNLSIYPYPTLPYPTLPIHPSQLYHFYALSYPLPYLLLSMLCDSILTVTCNQHIFFFLSSSPSKLTWSYPPSSYPPFFECTLLTYPMATMMMYHGLLSIYLSLGIAKEWTTGS